MDRPLRKFEAPIYTPPAPRGRPRKAVQQDENGHIVGTPTQETQAKSGNGNGAAVHITCAPVSPRLLDLHVSAGYLGLSEWTIRTLEQQGILKRVRIPLPNQGELRKLLFDKADLDQLIESWKDGTDHA